MIRRYNQTLEQLEEHRSEVTQHMNLLLALSGATVKDGAEAAFLEKCAVEIREGMIVDCSAAASASSAPLEN